ncbi:hypothetical protein CEXT_108541 [Caerostris extrusa]|uniref:Uncharacterized protein n=1 Tax=Caerostris extrusa TaxID=172846 RepID=A0AAV4SRD7_CAEEX|nr:hypothetical protein CEXT_108541 [Caerostris extrusa]
MCDQDRQIFRRESSDLSAAQMPSEAATRSQVRRPVGRSNNRLSKAVWGFNVIGGANDYHSFAEVILFTV